MLKLHFPVCLVVVKYEVYKDLLRFACIIYRMPRLEHLLPPALLLEAVGVGSFMNNVQRGASSIGQHNNAKQLE